MAIPEWVYVPYMASHGPSQQYQCRQGQALPLLVGSLPKPLPFVWRWQMFNRVCFHATENVQIENKRCAHLQYR